MKRSERFEGVGRLKSHGPETARLALFFSFGGISQPVGAQPLVRDGSQGPAVKAPGLDHCTARTPPCLAF